MFTKKYPGLGEGFALAVGEERLSIHCRSWASTAKQMPEAHKEMREGVKGIKIGGRELFNRYFYKEI